MITIYRYFKSTVSINLKGKCWVKWIRCIYHPTIAIQTVRLIGEYITVLFRRAWYPCFLPLSRLSFLAPREGHSVEELCIASLAHPVCERAFVRDCTSIDVPACRRAIMLSRSGRFLFAWKIAGCYVLLCKGHFHLLSRRIVKRRWSVAGYIWMFS